MFIKSYGVFWRADEVDWNPGKGARDAFRFLGRRGVNLPGLRIADFRHQQGIYILYDDYGPYYVGLTKKQGLGKRLKDHLSDCHKGKWDRFSWFGFKELSGQVTSSNLEVLRDMDVELSADPNKVITDIEALLIKSMGLRNIRNMAFSDASEWIQIRYLEIDSYLEKLAKK